LSKITFINKSKEVCKRTPKLPRLPKKYFFKQKRHITNMNNGSLAGIFCIGIGIGLGLPSLPAPLNVLNPWLWIIFGVVGIILIIKGN
jgi:hypothetical protein